MQSDGNLVVYTSSGRANWMSGASRANRLNATTTSNYGMLQSGEYGAVACLRDAVAPGSYLAVSRIGAEFFPDKAAMAQAKAVYERASEPIWARSRDVILGFGGCSGIWTWRSPGWQKAAVIPGRCSAVRGHDQT